MKPLFISSAVLLATLSLSSCWVEQVVQGVQPDLFPSDDPVTLSSQSITDITNQTQAMSYLGTRLIHLGRETAQLSLEIPLMASQRQSLENHFFFNLKSSLSGWAFINGEHTKSLPNRSAQAYVRFLNTQGQPYSFDVLAPGSYGPSPLPAQAFPKDYGWFELRLDQRIPKSINLSQSIQGKWPSQIPLQGAFNTETVGQGTLTDTKVKDETFAFDYTLNGQVSSDARTVDNQVSTRTQLLGREYNAFLRVDQTGISNTVFIQEKGVTVATIEKNDDAWQVKMDGQVIASAR